MWRALVTGVGVGLAVALPLGAIGLLVVRTGTERGARAGVAAGAGVAGADLLYAAVAATTGGLLVRPLTAAAGPLRVAAGVVLLAIAAHGALGALRPPPAAAPPPRPAGPLWRTFAAFLALTLLNPLTVVTFGAVVVALPPDLLPGAGDRAAFVLGAGGASLAWQSVLGLLGGALGARLTPRWQRATTLLGNAAIAVLAIATLAG